MKTTFAIPALALFAAAAALPAYAADVSAHTSAQVGSMAGTNTGMEGKVYSGTSTPSEASLHTMLPAGTHSYTYYSTSRVYYAPDTQTYYYPAAGNVWVTGTVAPEGVKLGNGTNVQLQGLGATNENTISK
ncbi:MAG: hypothetical protein GC129_06900 [Proteobacteria bacterium]|nr:hypothetical protein [Pseudomonadota bacterium]